MEEYVVHPSYFEIRDKNRPATPLEALMQCDFGEEPEESSLEREARLQDLAALLEDAMDTLTPEEREVVEGVIYEHLSLRRLAERVHRPDGTHYGKTWIAHLRDSGMAKLHDYLSEPEHHERVLANLENREDDL